MQSREQLPGSPVFLDDCQSPLREVPGASLTPTPLPTALTARPWEGAGRGRLPGTDPWGHQGASLSGEVRSLQGTDTAHAEAGKPGAGSQKCPPAGSPENCAAGAPGGELSSCLLSQPRPLQPDRAARLFPGPEKSPGHGDLSGLPSQGHSMVAPRVLPEPLDQARSVAWRGTTMDGQTDRQAVEPHTQPPPIPSAERTADLLP